MSAPRTPTWLTVADIAEQIGLSRMTVYRMIEKGTIRAFRHGRAYRVSEADLNRYMQAADTWTRP